MHHLAMLDHPADVRPRLQALSHRHHLGYLHAHQLALCIPHPSASVEVAISYLLTCMTTNVFRSSRIRTRTWSAWLWQEVNSCSESC